MAFQDINTVLNSFRPITLEEMDCIRLMNRMDTKYVFPANLVPELLTLLQPDYRTLEILNKRAFHYNTNYFDTSDLLFYTQHVTGKLARYKVRYRKYESTGNSFLEIKKRTNKNRTVKWRMEKDPERGITDDNALLFIRKHIPFNSFVLAPSLENSFTRITLAGISGMERITIDTCMSYNAPEGVSMDLPFLAIGEIKSEGYPGRSPFVNSIRKLHIQSTGFSKYCMGNALLKDIPRKNILKEKILLINKIENEYSKSDGS